MPVNPAAARPPARTPARAAKAWFMRLTIDSYWAAIRPQAWVVAMPIASSVCAASRSRSLAAVAAAPTTPITEPQCQPNLIIA